MKTDQLFDVRERSVVITGGASGLGLGIARALADNGARVTIADINAAAIEKVLPQLGPEASGEILDVTDRQAADRAFDAIDRRRGGIDVVFANAGVGGAGGFVGPNGAENPEATIDGTPDTEWRQVISVNLDGARNTCAAAARVMKARGRGGRIIITSSAAAQINVPFVSTAYHVTKAGVSHLRRQLAIELAPHQILVNTISPANFITNIGDGAMYDEAVQATFARTSLLGRMAEAEEIAGLALFLASGASSFVTGADLLIDGGACLAGAAASRNDG